MTSPLTWEACAAAGMSAAEAARAMGFSKPAATQYARRNGLKFRDGRFKNGGARNPAANPLAKLTPAERADYDLIKRKKFTRAEALRLVGRHDLVMAQ